MQGSAKVEVVARWFGVSKGFLKGVEVARPGGEVVVPEAGEIVLITGASGAGKSSLLRRCRRWIGRAERIELERVRWPGGKEAAVVDCFPALSVEETLRALARVGLGEAQSYLARPRELSEGMRWRLRLAMAMEAGRGMEGSPCLVCDEFAALLDRVTARVVGRVLRRVVDGGGMRAVVATSHEDLEAALGADVVVRCDFGKVVVERKGRAGRG